MREKYGLKLQPHMDQRLAETCVLMVVNSMLIHPLEKNENIKFIYETLQCIIVES